LETAILEKCVDDHRHERLTMQALPGSALEVVKTEFFFQLLVRLLANPARSAEPPTNDRAHEKPIS
jgi:hypothetical protein